MQSKTKKKHEKRKRDFFYPHFFGVVKYIPLLKKKGVKNVARNEKKVSEIETALNTCMDAGHSSNNFYVYPLSNIVKMKSAAFIN